MAFWKGKYGKRNLLALVLFPMIAFMLFRWFEHSQIYHPYSAHESSPEAIGREFKEVYLGDKPKLHAWFFPAQQGSARTNLTFLICHGNGGNISHRLDLCDLLLETGANVFIFDYRGYGRSSGRPSEEGTYADAQAAYGWLKQNGFASEQIIALGESLGGAVAAELAVREKLGGLILQSTFTCIPDIGAELFSWLPVRQICSIHYDTGRKLPGLKLPVMVMHSRSDTLIGFQHAEKNFAIANEPKLFWELKGNHNDTLVTDSQIYFRGIEEFLTLLEQK